MNAFEYILPPNVYGTRRIQGYLEVEVSRIHFIIDGRYNIKEEVEKSAQRKKKKTKTFNAATHTYTHPPPTNCKKDSSNNNYQLNNSTLVENKSVIAKFERIVENHETAASICISSSKSVKRTNHQKQKKVRQQSRSKQQDGRKAENSLVSASSSSSASALLASAPSSSSSLVLQYHNKIRYNICISLALFLEYLHSCEPIEIIVVGCLCGSAASGGGGVVGQAYLRLPSVLLRKYTANYTTGCTFEHKKEIGSLYRNKNISRTIIDQQPQEKTGDTQLRFRMLFAASATANLAPAVLQKQLDEPKDDDNNPQLESTHFTADTSKIRLLKGFIYASEMRNHEMSTKINYILVCRRFWQEEAAIATAIAELNEFNYQEQFSIIHDEKFINRCEKQHLQLEVWQRINTDVEGDCEIEHGEVSGDNEPGDGNCNTKVNVKGNLQSVGIVQLPLHQFFIAYRDDSITNRLCKGKFPVISIDAWVPIVNFESNCTNVGELKCLLAIGSEEQITNLKMKRGFDTTISSSSAGAVSKLDAAFLSKNSLDVVAVAAVTTETSSNDSWPSTSTAGLKLEMKDTSDLFDILEQALKYPVTNVPASNTVATPAHPSAMRPDKRRKPEQITFMLDIQRASGLPLNPAAKGKKAPKRSAAASSKRFPPNEAPSTYVTFQAIESDGKAYKSHEGEVYATNIIAKSTQPEWQQRFRVVADIEYLTNPQKLFILKVWKKATFDSGKNRMEPTPIDDGIIGFAALKLIDLLAGLEVKGGFNIVHFNGRLNGQLELRCQIFEDVKRLFDPPSAAIPTILPPSTLSSPSSEASMDTVIGQFENSLDLTHLNLGQAIKRKFTELEGISQRLRTRLADVTGEPLSPNFNISILDSWQPFHDGSSDEDDRYSNEFERKYSILSPSTATCLTPPVNTDKDFVEDSATATADNSK